MVVPFAKEGVDGDVFSLILVDRRGVTEAIARTVT